MCHHRDADWLADRAATLEAEDEEPAGTDDEWMAAVDDDAMETVDDPDDVDEEPVDVPPADD